MNVFCLMSCYSDIIIAKPPSFWFIFAQNFFLSFLIFLYSYFIVFCKHHNVECCLVKHIMIVLKVFIPTILQLFSCFTFNVNNLAFKSEFECTTLLLFCYMHQSFMSFFFSMITICCVIKVFCLFTVSSFTLGYFSLLLVVI